MVVAGAAARIAAITAAKCAAPTIFQVVAVDRGDHHMAQAKRGHGIGDAGLAPCRPAAAARRLPHCKRRRRGCRSRP